MYGFHFLVSTLGVRGIKDTQCGFKLFTRNAAQWVFANQRLERWVFDAELLMIARSLGIPIAEVAVNWHEVPGSKLNIVNASLEMARDLLWLRICYSLKIWTISTPKSLFAQDRLKSS
jgi:dolichyl-phosphate beta-glucosyltransferase